MFVGIGNGALGMRKALTGRSVTAGDTKGFTADITFQFLWIRKLINILSPVLHAFVHVLARDCPSFKVCLQCNGTSKGHFIRIGQSTIQIRTKANRTEPVLEPKDGMLDNSFKDSERPDSGP